MAAREPGLGSFVGWMLVLCAGIMLLGGAARFTGILYFPWEVQMKTQMLRNSNEYTTTQIGALRQLATSFADPQATPAQRAAIRLQMRIIIDQLTPGTVPPDLLMITTGE